MILAARGIVETVFNVYDRLKWHEPDSIGYGGLGRGFLAMELYRHTHDQRIKKDILGSLQEAEQYRKLVRTNNYSLFNGRSGLAYYYLECFKLTKEEVFLVKAYEILKGFIGESSYSIRSFDHSGLVNGTAGMLIPYLSLYEETGEEWIMEFIGQRLLTMMSQANLTEAGVYWHGIRLTDRQPGWAYGSYGVAFCLCQLGQYFKNKHLLSIADFAIKEEDRFRGSEALGYGNGITGDSLVKLYLSTQGHHPEYEEQWTNVARLLDEVLEGDPKDIPADIFNGMAGWGLAFYEAHLFTKDEKYRNSAQKIASILYERMLNILDTGADVWDSSFFSGVSGIGYSFLKIIGNGDSPSILMPRLTNDPANSWVNRSEAGPDLIDLAGINSSLLENNFRRTNGIMKAKTPELHYKLSTIPSAMNLSGFKISIDHLIGDLPDNLRAKLLESTELDIVINGLKIEAFKYQPERNGDPEKGIDVITRLDADGILGLKLAISETVFILNREDFIDYSKSVTESFVMDKMLRYGDRSYYFWYDGFAYFCTFELGRRKLLTDLFARPVTVSEALNTLLGFVTGQDKQVVQAFCILFNAKDEGHLKEAIRSLVLKTTKMMLLEGILEVFRS